MSKEAGLRAMREARYASRRAGTPATRMAAPVAPPAAKKAATPEAADDALCGHKSMNGRTCTREAGHAAKSHRYG